MAEGVVSVDGKLSSETSQSPPLSALTAEASDASPSPPRLVIVVGEPLGETHKDAVVKRIATELQAWDVTESGCNLGEQLETFSSQDPEVKSGTSGESLLRWKSDAATVDVLINPCVHSVEAELLEFVLADTHYRFVLFAGHAVAETGSWLLRDGTLSFYGFVSLFSSSRGGTGPIDVATYSEGDWSPGRLAKCAPARLRLNPEKTASSDGAALTRFASVLASRISVETVPELLQGTDVIGVVPFNRPTVNIFQGGNGISALFGVRGFSMLVDAGYPRRTCCWDFVRHMDHIDVVIFPHVGESNVMGAKSFVERLAVGDVRTAIGQVFINTGAGKAATGVTAAGDSITTENDSLLVSLNEVGVSVVSCLAKSRILRAPCVAKIPPQAINLYHKIGFGSLDLLVLNPVADSKDLKEFLAGWGNGAKSRGSKLNDLVSVSSVVVFRPETRGDRPVRILFPGSAPVSKLHEGLDCLKLNPLFQTVDGLEKPPVQKSGADKVAARPGSGAAKPSTARPASSSSARDAQPARTGTKVASKVANTTATESKRTSSEAGNAVKARDQRPTREARPVAKADSAKDSKAHPTTSTPKKDAQKQAASKSDTCTAKVAAVPTARKAATKQSASPIVDKTKTQSARHKAERSSAESEAQAAVAAGEPTTTSGDTAAADSTAEVIPELVPCTTEPGTAPAAESDAPAAESDAQQPAQDCHAAVSEADSVQQPEPVSTDAESNSDEKVVATELCVEAVADNGTESVPAECASVEVGDSQVTKPAEEFDPAQSWDAPQSLPAPSDDKVVGSMPPHGKSAPRVSTSGTGKRPAAASNVPASARGATSATKKPGPVSRPTTPFYVDLAYVPTYAVDGCDAEFFRRVRSRYYVIPGSSADPHQLSMLANAKSAWDGDVTVIPTGNTDSLIAWVMAHRDELASLKIEVSPSVARSTLQLDRGSVCSAYRLEF